MNISEPHFKCIVKRTCTDCIALKGRCFIQGSKKAYAEVIGLPMIEYIHATVKERRKKFVGYVLSRVAL